MSLAPCPVCKLEKCEVARSGYGDRDIINCRRCGSYQISGDLMSSVDSTAFDEERIGRISGYLRLKNAEGIKDYLLTTYSLQEIEDSEAIPGIRDIEGKLKCILSALIRKTANFGNEVVLNISYDSPLGFCRNHEEFAALLKELEKRELININGKTLDGNYYLTLTVEGYRGELLDKNFSDDSKDAQSFLLNPRTPYSNKLALKKWLQSCGEDVLWVDKYMSNTALELLHDWIQESEDPQVKSIRLLGYYPPFQNDSKLRSRYKDFQSELDGKGIKTEFRILDREHARTIHGRWLVGTSKTYVGVSADILVRGQHDEIHVHETDESHPFQEWWRSSLDVITDWHKVNQLIVASESAKEQSGKRFNEE